MHNPNPVGRSEAFSVLAHLAQDLAMEVDWAESLRQENSNLKIANKKLVEERDELKKSINSLRESDRALRNAVYIKNDKYLALLAKYEPENYEKEKTEKRGFDF